MDSPVWGKAIRNFRKMINKDKYIIGLTGDPIRYFDNCKNVVDTIFNNHVVYGHNQYEAIMNGILPDVIYVCAVYGTKELYDEYYPKATTNQLKGKLNFVYENCKKINDIILSHALDNMKGFVFVDRIKSIDTGIDIISSAFPNMAVRSAHSNMSKSEKYDNIEAFKKDNSGFMVAVDMFNEGHHINGVNTIIMLRKTGSPTIYSQQIGRGLSANYTGVTVVYDFVANKESMKNISKRISIITNMIGIELDKNNIRKSKFSSNNKISKQIIVHDYSKDFLEVIEEIDDANSKIAWTEYEDQILKDNYNTNGIDICIKELGRSRISCQKRARRLGLVKPKKDWSEDEDNILREYYPIMGRKVASKLEGRSERACTARANNYLGLVAKTKDEWPAAEINLLKKQYMIDGDNVKLPNRTNEECVYKLKDIGIDVKLPWSDYEKQILIDNYPSIGEDAFIEIKNRSDKECREMVKLLDLHTKKWTKSEVRILKDNYPHMGSSISDLLPDKSINAIRFKAHSLGIRCLSRTYGNNTRAWKSYEDKILIDNYKLLGKDIVKLLPGRSYESIKYRACILGVSASKNKWSSNEDQIIIDNYPKLGSRVVELLPNRSSESIKMRAKRLGIVYNAR